MVRRSWWRFRFDPRREQQRLSDDVDSQRRLLWSLLGDLPPRDLPLKIECRDAAKRGKSVVENVTIHVGDYASIPAYVARPEHVGEPAPALLYSHAHGGDYTLGKEEFLHGRDCLQAPAYLDLCIDNGWVGLCIDQWNFGERHAVTESALFKEMLWRGQVLWGMMIYDSVRALDYLCSRPDVNETRVAAIGLSMGSTLSWWLAALDERVKVCVDLCCLTDFEALIEDEGLDRHGLYYYVPGLLKHFSTANINALISPRAHLSLTGKHDPLTPAAGLQRIDAELKQVYGAASAHDNWRLSVYNCGHEEPQEMRREIVEWLRRKL